MTLDFEQIKSDRVSMDNRPTLVGAYIHHRMPELSHAVARDAAMCALDRVQFNALEAYALATRERLGAADWLAEACEKLGTGEGTVTKMERALAAYHAAGRDGE